jgi:gamma-glutamylcysteine synthetase
MDTKGYRIVFSGSPAEVMLAAQMQVNTASARCKVFIVSKKGKEIAVAVLIGSSPAWGKTSHSYTPASEYGITKQYRVA